jgi:hypothetical protein
MLDKLEGFSSKDIVFVIFDADKKHMKSLVDMMYLQSVPIDDVDFLRVQNLSKKLKMDLEFSPISYQSKPTATETPSTSQLSHASIPKPRPTAQVSHASTSNLKVTPKPQGPSRATIPVVQASEKVINVYQPARGSKSSTLPAPPATQSTSQDVRPATPKVTPKPQEPPRTTIPVFQAFEPVISVIHPARGNKATNPPPRSASRTRRSASQTPSRTPVVRTTAKRHSDSQVPMVSLPLDVIDQNSIRGFKRPRRSSVCVTNNSRSPFSIVKDIRGLKTKYMPDSKEELKKMIGADDDNDENMLI